MERTVQKLGVFADVCESIRSLSYDTKHRVGAIIFNSDFSSIVSIGYNGNYRGGPNERDSQASGQSGFIHAELNALFKCDTTRPNLVIMCTWTPCWHCAKCIANSGVTRAFFLKRYVKDQRFEKILADAGVKYHILDEERDKWNKEEITRVLA